jgi:phosphoserine phosphatase RsbU/P
LPTASGAIRTCGACCVAACYGDQALRAFAAGIAPAAATAATAINAISALLEGLGDGLDDDDAAAGLALSVRPSPADPADQPPTSIEQGKYP